MKQDARNGFTSFDELPTIDPAVDSILGQGERRQFESRLTQSAIDLKKRLEARARQEGVPISQLVAFLLYEPLQKLEEETISLWRYKTPSGCPKFDCNLDLKRREKEAARK